MTISTNRHSSVSPETFVLGAGFSRAISDALPLTDELGNEVVARDEHRLNRPTEKVSFENGNFEAWLSRRAEDQPYLSPAENLAGRAVFARGTSLIAEVLDERVNTALAAEMPTWLGELISYWHLKRSNVITFNYDTLIECAFETMDFWDWRSETQFQWGSLLNYSPGGKAGHSYGEVEGTAGPHDTFRLWKMHGSLNWHWVVGDNTGATVRRGRLPGTFGAPNAVEPAELHWAAPGRERFIVPPAALKSGYYANPITREIWRRAYSSLAGAGTVTLMGYSIPSTDISTSGMLAEALAHSTERIVRIVDFRPGAPDDPRSIPWRVKALGNFETTIELEPDGARAIETYVSRLIREASCELVEELVSADIDQHTPVFIDWGNDDRTHRAAAIVGVSNSPNGSGTLLRAEELTTSWTATRSREADTTGALSVPWSLRQLRGAAELGYPLSVVVDGFSRSVPIISFAIRRFPTGHGNGMWIQLVPAGMP